MRLEAAPLVVAVVIHGLGLGDETIETLNAIGSGP